MKLVLKTWAVAAGLSIGIWGCAHTRDKAPAAAHATNTSAAAGGAGGEAEAPEPGETKISLDQAPPAVRKTIDRELVGAQLEDIARKDHHGKTVYETDVIRGGQKWEVVVAEDGSVLSKIKEGSPEEEKSEKEAGEAREAGWRENFDVSKSNLSATGNNTYLAIQPGRVLKLRHR